MTLTLAALLLLQHGQDAKTTWASNCRSCHFAPDQELKTDRVWLGMIKTTA